MINVGGLIAFLGLDTSQAESSVAGMKTQLAGLGTAGTRTFFNMQHAVGGFSKGLQHGMKMSAEMQGLMIGMAINPFTIAIGGAALFTAGVKKTIEVASEFEKEWANVTTLLHMSAQDMNEFRRELMLTNPELGKITELSKAMYQALSASVKPAESVESVGHAAMFAKAALTSQFDSIDVGTTVINAYGMEIDRLSNVYDVLFKTIELGKTTGEELAGTFGRVIPVAAALNVPLEDLAAVTATLTRGGLSTDEAITSLRQTLAQFLSPSKQAKDLAAELGVELSAEAIQAKGLAKALADLAAKSQNNSEAIGVFFENIRALIGVLALTGAQADDLAEIQEKLKNSSGSVRIAFEKQTDTLRSQLEILGAVIERYETLFGLRPTNWIKNWVKGINKDLTDMLYMLADFDMSMENLGENILELTFNLRKLAFEFSTGGPGAVRIGTFAFKKAAEWNMELNLWILRNIMGMQEYHKLAKLMITNFPDIESLIPGDVFKVSFTKKETNERLRQIDMMFAKLREKPGFKFTEELRDELERLEEDLPELEIKARYSSDFEQEKQLLIHNYKKLMDMFEGYEKAKLIIFESFQAEKTILNRKFSEKEKEFIKSVELEYLKSTNNILEANKREYEMAAEAARNRIDSEQELNRVLNWYREIRESKDEEYYDKKREYEEELFSDLRELHDSFYMNDIEQVNLWYTQQKRIFMLLTDDADKLRESLELLAEVREAKIDVIGDREAKQVEDFIQEVTDEYNQLFKTKKKLLLDEHINRVNMAAAIIENEKEFQTTLFQLEMIYAEKKRQLQWDMVKFSQRTAEAMEDAFSMFFVDAMKGELDGLREYFIAFLEALQKAVSEILGQLMKELFMGKGDELGGLFGAVFSGLGFSLGGPSAAQQQIAVYQTQGAVSAFSNVSAVPSFAKGGVVTNFAAGGLVDKPVVFPMQRGAGVMGEAGPEAVVPLSRTSSGELGVKTTDTKQDKPLTIQLNIAALDSKSFVEFTRRNPNAIIGPFVEALQRGHSQLRTVIKETR